MGKLLAVSAVVWALLALPRQGRGDEVRLCGRMLAEALSLLCEGRYNGPPSTDNRLGKREVVASYGTKDVDAFPSWFLAVAGSKGTHRRPPGDRQERGVVDECCRKACTSSTLLSYCGSRSKRQVEGSSHF